MDGFIGMNTGEALNIMGRIETYRASMQESMSSISREVEALKDVWHGNRCDNFCEYVAELVTKFQNFDEAIADASTEIKNTASGYSTIDGN